VAEVGATPETDQVYRLTYDGSVADEHGFVAMGGGAEQIETGLKEQWREGMNLSEALVLAVGLLGADPAGGPTRELAPTQLEVAVLDRNRPRRTFRRITGQLLERLLSADDPTRDAPAADDGADDHSVRDVSTNPQTQRPAQDGPPE
jgi:proteasome alpha subunit